VRVCRAAAGEKIADSRELACALFCDRPNRLGYLVKKLQIGIVGGSIAGCAAAIELSRLGHAITLFERSGEELKDRGAGLGVPPSVIETFKQRDLIDAEIPAFAAGAFVRRWRTPAESRYGYLAWNQPTTMALLNWGALYRSLRERVPAGAYRTEQRVIRLTEQHNQVLVDLADGAQYRFDLVVCGDGYLSLGRQTLFPHISLPYAGYVLWRGSLPELRLTESAPLENGIHAIGYRGGHGIFYFVPGFRGEIAKPQRVVNWGIYTPVPDAEIRSFLTDKAGRTREGSLPPGAMPMTTELALKTAARERLPDYYADIVELSVDTSAYAIYDCEVPAYRHGLICLMGDAAAFARPHSGAGAFKGMNDAAALSDALRTHDDLEAALADWNTARTESGNQLVRFGNQLGHALVKEIPDWSTMDAASMESWFTSLVTVKAEMFHGYKR
jgi:2-polyprenyl-6-methoxyphenol hydroxylase-like FAD-dependent oxidoreductase